MLKLEEKKEGLVFNVRVQPRSSRNKLSGLMGDALKINLTAPPVDNAANKLCIEFLADCLKVPKAMLQIVTGHTSRNKQILLRYPQGSHLENARRLVQRQIFTLLPKDEKKP